MFSTGKAFFHLIRFIMVSLSLVLFLPCTMMAMQDHAEDYLFEIFSSEEIGDVHNIWRSGVRLAGRGSGSHPVYNNNNDFPHPYVWSKWESDIGFGGAYCITLDFWDIEQAEESIDMLEIGDRIDDIIAGGGLPILILYGVPDSISSCPLYNEECSGRPTYPPADYHAWEQLVYDAMTYLSVEGARVTNPILNLDDAHSRGLDGIYYHVWNEPNTNPVELGGQPGEFHGPTAFWKGSREDFQQLYRSTVSALERVEHDFGIELKIGGCDFQRVEEFLYQVSDNDSENWIVDFVQYCHQNRLRLDFFTWNRISNNPDYYDENHVSEIWRRMLDGYGYTDTELILVDVSSHIYVTSQNSIGNTIAVERESEILASLIPAMFYKEVQVGMVERIVLEAIQNYNVDDENHDYGLFRGGVGQMFTLSNVMKPAFNTFAMISQLRDRRLRVSKDIVSDISDAQDPEVLASEYIDCLATVDSQTGDLAILVWYYFNPDMYRGGVGQDLRYEDLNEELPGPKDARIWIHDIDTKDQYTMHRYKLDATHSNSWYHRDQIYAELNNSDIKADEINNWPGVRLQESEIREFQGESSLEIPLLIRPYSVHLIILEKTEGSQTFGETGGGEEEILENMIESLNYPNPFDEATTIRFQVSPVATREARYVESIREDGGGTLAGEENNTIPMKVQVFDLRGRLVQSLLNEDVEIGVNHLIQWQARNERGDKVPLGMYFYRMEIPNRVYIKKMNYTGRER